MIAPPQLAADLVHQLLAGDIGLAVVQRLGAQLPALRDLVLDLLATLGDEAVQPREGLVLAVAADRQRILELGVARVQVALGALVGLQEGRVAGDQETARAGLQVDQQAVQVGQLLLRAQGMGAPRLLTRQLAQAAVTAIGGGHEGDAAGQQQARSHRKGQQAHGWSGPPGPCSYNPADAAFQR